MVRNLGPLAQVSYKVAIKVRQDCIHFEVHWVKFAPKVTHIIVGRIWFMQALGPRASVLICLLLSRDLSQFLDMRASPRAVHNAETSFNQSEQVRDQEMVSKMQDVSCCLLILAVTSHHCLPYLFISSKSLGPTHTRKCKYQEEGSLRVI